MPGIYRARAQAASILIFPQLVIKIDAILETDVLVIFNGEILFLRNEEKLVGWSSKAVGYRSYSASYHEWGSCSDHFIGMFAFVIMILYRKTCFVVSRAGVKPFFLLWKNDLFMLVRN
jgi:asparagine synthetase B (glutamine-hydrolysing)